MNFVELFLSGGPVMFPLLLISIAAVAFAVERFIAFNEFGHLAPGLSEEVMTLVQRGRANDAVRRAEEVPGPVAAALATVLRNRTLPVEDMRREVEVTLEDYFARLERFLPALDTFTTLSPLLGLLGTILGMVRVFQQFTGAGNDEGQKAQILAGVGESLYATAFGISIAIFCFAIYNFFAARRRNVAIATDQAAARLMSFFHQQQLTAALAAGQPPVRKKARRTSAKSRELKRTKVEIIPMIDTMFFLLVFFILSSVGIIKLQGLPVQLPDANNAERQQPAQITISIDGSQHIKINNTNVQAGQNVGPILEREVKVQTVTGASADIEKAVVVLNADRTVPNGVVVRTIDQARTVGIARFTIATQKPTR